MAGSRQGTRLEAENYVPDRLLCCMPSAAQPVIKSKYRAGRSSFISGELKSVEYSIYLCLTGELLWPPQKATLDSLCTLFWFVSYRRLSSQFQFSLSLVTLEYLSQWEYPIDAHCTRWGSHPFPLLWPEVWWGKFRQQTGLMFNIWPIFPSAVCLWRGSYGPKGGIFRQIQRQRVTSQQTKKFNNLLI